MAKSVRELLGMAWKDQATYLKRRTFKDLVLFSRALEDHRRNYEANFDRLQLAAKFGQAPGETELG